MKLSTTQIVLISIVLVIVIAAVLLFTGVIPGLRPKNNPNNVKSTLTVWGVFDSNKAINDSLIPSFAKKAPNVTVFYRQMDPRTYEEELVNALAAGTGPDIFYVKNTWLIRHADKLSPIDPKELPVSKLAELFPDIVVSDFTLDGRVYAMPLYLDTLALFYNKDIFDQNGIPQPPRTWKEFEQVVSKLTRFDQLGRITRAGAAIGSSARNVNEATDMLSLLMMQDGTQMINKNLTEATFSRGGDRALEYYTSFANPSNPAYTWDPLFHYSIDAFAEESVAMIFNYAYQISQLKAKNPFLDFAVAPMPQQAGAPKEINFASYWGLGVANTSRQPKLAWDFIRYSTTDQIANIKYLNAATRPPALRSLISISLEDPAVGVFARQALTAVDWPQVDATAIDAAFTRMIDLVNSGQLDIRRAIKQAEETVTQLLRTRLGTVQ